MKLSEVTGGGMKLSEATAPKMPSYDPATAMPLGDVPLGMQPSDVKELGKGVIEGAVGIPLNVVSSLFRFGKQTPQQYDTSIFEKPKDEGAAKLRELGDIGGSLLSPMPLGGAAKGTKKAVEIGERVLPGATQRAADFVRKIGNPGNSNTIGRAIVDKIGARFRPMFEARQKEFAKWLSEHDPQKKLFQTPEDRAAAEAAFDRDFAGKYKELSKDINQFGDTLGKHATQSVKYTGDMLRFDPIKIPNDAFRSQASVESFKRLVQDDKFVNDTAREWVATQLHEATKPAITGVKEGALKLRSIAAANKAREWYDKAHRDWLQFLPEIDNEARSFVENFEKVAKTQSKARYVGGAAGTAAAVGLGFHPVNRILRELGLGM